MNQLHGFVPNPQKLKETGTTTLIQRNLPLHHHESRVSLNLEALNDIEYCVTISNSYTSSPIQENFISTTLVNYIQKTLQRRVSYKTKREAKAYIYHIKKLLWIQKQYRISLFIIARLHERISLLHQQIKAYEKQASSYFQMNSLNHAIDLSPSGITLINIRLLKKNDSFILNEKKNQEIAYILTQSTLNTISLQIQASHQTAIASSNAIENVYTQENMLLETHAHIIDDILD